MRCSSDPDTGQPFDINSDPGEEHNLWGDPATAATRTDLLDRLRDWHLATAAHTAGHHAGAR